MAPGGEVDSPVVADGFVSGVAVNVLPLRHVDAGNLCSVHLEARVAVASKTTRSSLVQLWSLVRTDSLRVGRNVSDSVLGNRDSHSLDSAILKSVGVGGVSGGSGPDVALELGLNDGGSFSRNNSRDSSDRSLQ